MRFMNDFQENTAALGSLIVISAPSGAGKSSLIKALLAATPGLGVSVSHTTRPMRPGEVGGEHYHFVDADVFRSLVKADAFIEYAEVFGNYYGTAKSSLEGPLREGKDLILEIDWQGARQVRTAFPDALSIFILPPSIEALRHRLDSRSQDSGEIIERRMREAGAEIAHRHEFDYLVINDDFDTALAELGCLVKAARLRYSIQAARCASSLTKLDG